MDSEPSCDIINDTPFFRLMFGCSIDIDGIGGETATEHETMGRIGLHL